VGIFVKACTTYSTYIYALRKTYIGRDDQLLTRVRTLEWLEWRGEL
jgi:hypothetical protein